MTTTCKSDAIYNFLIAIKIGVLVLCLFSSSVGIAQSINLTKSVSNPNPLTEEVFNYILDLSCSSSTGPCIGVEIRDTLPGFVEFLNFSAPLPSGVQSATFDPTTREALVIFDNTLSSGTTVQLFIQVRFPNGTLQGSQANNVAYAYSNNAGTSIDNAIATASNGIPTGDFPDDKGGSNSVISGGYQFWNIEVGNIGFGQIDDYSVLDTIPDDVVFDQIRTPEFPGVDHSGQLFYQRSDMPGTWLLWTNFNLNDRDPHYVTDLGLPSGVRVSMVRLDLFSLTGSGIYNPYIYPDQFERGWTLYGFVDSTLVVGDSFTNCAYYSGSTSGIPISDVDCLSTTIQEPSNNLGGSLIILDDTDNLSNSFSLEDSLYVEVQYFSTSRQGFDFVGGVMSVILPPNISYAPGTVAFNWGEENADFQIPVVETETLINGRELVRIVFDSSYNNSFILEPSGFWDGFNIGFSTFISPAALEGNYDIEYYYNATGSTHDNCNVPDVSNYLNDYASDYCLEISNINVVRPPGSAGIESKIEVIGTLDTDYSTYPDRALTVPGGISDYKITIKNPNAAEIDKLELITVLPHIGDTEVLDITQPRFSDWQPSLAAPLNITVPQLEVRYTTVTDPCRDELAGSNPTPFPAGCNPPGWDVNPPSDITTVTALKFDYEGSLDLNDSIVVDFAMRSPVNAFPDTSIAWNSFAYTARNKDENTDLLPAEPIKVGIELRPGNVPILGDWVWQDLEPNGIQDAGEVGIDGVRVELYHDVNNNNIAEPGGPDTLELWTVTAAGGYYLFSDFDFGRYFVVFSDFPAGFNPTYTDIGSDVTDSDGPITPVILCDNTTERYDVDFGLFDGILPERCLQAVMNPHVMFYKRN